jgi:hypothetical protein
MLLSLSRYFFVADPWFIEQQFFIDHEGISYVVASTVGGFFSESLGWLCRV